MLLHRGAKTRLLLDFLTDFFEVLSSIQQGNPISMPLFTVYIEPFLLVLEKATKGFPLEAPLRGGPHSISFEATREHLEGYVDDTEVVIVSDQELLLVEGIVKDFEAVSGAILNRSHKSKILGIGTWKDRKTWPLKWLKSVKCLKIFGIKMSANISSILDDNWSDVLENFRKTLHSWSNRSLCTLSERYEVLSVFGLSRLWYMSQILPLPATWVSIFKVQQT